MYMDFLNSSTFDSNKCCYFQEINEQTTHFEMHMDWYHPGFAQAWRREAFNQAGGLLDHIIFGANDWYMWRGLIGETVYEETRHSALGTSATRELQKWYNNVKELDQNVGYVDGSILHYWHGSTKNRRYKERTQIFVDNEYDHDRDIKKDWQGLWQFTNKNPGLIRDLGRYFEERDCDATS